MLLDPSDAVKTAMAKQILDRRLEFSLKSPTPVVCWWIGRRVGSKVGILRILGHWANRPERVPSSSTPEHCGTFVPII